MNIIGVLLYPIFFIGITFGIILFFGLVFSLIKFWKTHKKIYLIASIFIVFLFVYASVDISLPKTGKVLNALNGNHISGIAVFRVFYTIPVVFNPGGGSDEQKWYQKVETNNDGQYGLPLSFHIKVPFASSLSKVTINVPICEKDISYTENYYGCRDRSSLNYALENEYSDAQRLIGNDIYLIPKLTQIEKCDSLVKKELSNDCKSVNAIRIAIDNKNTNSCSYAFSVNGCVIQTAVATKDDKLCNSIGEGDSDRSLCLRNVATEKKDQKMCDSMSNSKWVSTTDNQGNIREWCVKIDESKIY